MCLLLIYCYFVIVLTGPVDLRNYRRTPQAAPTPRKITKDEVLKHCMMVCQPEMYKEITRFNPDKDELGKAKALFQKQRERQLEKERAGADTLARYHGQKPKLHEDDYDLEMNHPVLNEEQIRFGISKENFKEYEVLKHMLKCERENNRQHRIKYAEKMLVIQRRKIRVEHLQEMQRPPPCATVMGETMEEYIHHLRHNSLVESKTRPSFVPTPRVRRRIEEGSYPSWSVEEEELPTLLRLEISFQS